MMDVWFGIVAIIGGIWLIQFIGLRYTPLYRLNLYTKLYDYARWVKGEPKIFIMGSSHARHHLVPEEITKHTSQYTHEEIYNIGAGAASPFAMYVTFQKNREKFRQCERVYYVLNPHMMSEKYYLYTKYEKIFLNFRQWVYFTKHHKKYLKKHHQESNRYFFPAKIFYDSLEFNRPLSSGLNNGFSPLTHKPFSPYKENTIAKYIYDPINIFPISEFEILYLRKLKEELTAIGTQIIFVLTPTYSWAKFYAKEAEEYDSILTRKLNYYLGENLILGSLFGEDFGLEIEDYADDTHLSKSGAVKFTEHIFRDIDKHVYLKAEQFRNTFLYRVDN
jgi:hypothetical protein